MQFSDYPKDYYFVFYNCTRNKNNDGLHQFVQKQPSERANNEKIPNTILAEREEEASKY